MTHSQVLRRTLLGVALGASCTWCLAQVPAEIPREKQAETEENIAYFKKEGSRNGLKNLKIESKFEFPRVVVTGFSADLGGGKVSGTGRVDLFNPLGRQTMKVAYRKVALSAYVRSYLVKWDADITGTIDADLDLTWNGISRNGAKRTMNGTGTVRYSGGTIRRASAVTEAGKIAGIDRALPQTIRRGIAQGTITNGTLVIDQLRITGSQVAADATGSVNLSAGSANAEFRLFASDKLAGSSKNRGGGASWAGAAGKVALRSSILISGNLESASCIRAAER